MAKLLHEGCRYHKLQQIVLMFYRRHCELTGTRFYGDLVYKFKKPIIGKNDFSFHLKNIIRYKRIGYNLNVMRQSTCLVFNPVMVDNYAAFLTACRLVGRQTL